MADHAVVDEVGNATVCGIGHERVHLVSDCIGISAEVDLVEHWSVVRADGVEVCRVELVAALQVCGVGDPHRDLAGDVARVESRWNPCLEILFERVHRRVKRRRIPNVQQRAELCLVVADRSGLEHRQSERHARR